MKEALVLRINNAILLRKIGIERLQARDVGVVPNQGLIVENEVSRKYREVGDNHQHRDKNERPESFMHGQPLYQPYTPAGTTKDENIQILADFFI
jgi:hypothetical protein